MQAQPDLILNTASKASNKSPYFKTMTLIYQVALIVFGLNFGFFEYKSNKQRIFWMTVTICKSVVYAWVCLYFLDIYDNVEKTAWHFLFIFRYFIFVVVLVKFNPNTTICKLYKDLELLDLKMRVDESYNLEKRILIGLSLDLAFKFVIIYLLCELDNFCLKPFIPALAYFLLTISLNLVFFTYIFIFYSLNQRLKTLASILDTTYSDFSSLQHIYRYIVDMAELYKMAYDPVVILALLFYIPENMVNVYKTVYTLIYYEEIKSLLTYETAYLNVMESLMLAVSPAMFAGMLSTQADKIKVILHHKLMQERDETKAYDIERFIRYVEARPCQFCAYRVIPLSADLLTMVLNFSVTYLIVILQFNKK